MTQGEAAGRTGIDDMQRVDRSALLRGGHDDRHALEDCTGP
ncbi:hypothetical protein OG978_46835 (plasmid) [Streptomyces sp. NBC_01591]|nr:hypothetical protein [Streptomyces sp. NBC_01591]WSD66088.1 hypothetical protein OG978_00590 [Streptomyces sp. NBC_01591]WSD73029.1 hypothetical protein OG978_40240 [Streptomyces sp. NBC_01591]WSD73695.1 hypothetical protein OG978_41410 [Streptomyces sp. NBC_01591]WSD74516.1 hypothetical protein OG978_46835 [Streptomyces sp. NBC_01591]